MAHQATRTILKTASSNHRGQKARRCVMIRWAVYMKPPPEPPRPPRGCCMTGTSCLQNIARLPQGRLCCCANMVTARAPMIRCIGSNTACLDHRGSCTPIIKAASLRLASPPAPRSPSTPMTNGASPPPPTKGGFSIQVRHGSPNWASITTKPGYTRQRSDGLCKLILLGMREAWGFMFMQKMIQGISWIRRG